MELNEEEASTPVRHGITKRFHPESCKLSSRKRFKVPFKDSSIPVSPLGSESSKSREQNTPLNISPNSTFRRNLNQKAFKSPLLRTAKRSSVSNGDTNSTCSKIREAKEELRRLKLVEYHIKYNDLSLLDTITQRWREAGHKALHELQSLISQESSVTISEIMQNLNIPKEMINCDCDE